MKNKALQWITVVAFCAFLAVMPALYLLLPKADFSELEKRYLEDAPLLTAKTLTSGQYGEDMESYMADHIPGRDFFVGLNAYVDLYTGRQVSKDIYVTEDNRLVEAPVVWNETQAQKNMTAVNQFAQTIGADVDFMIVPSAGWAVEDRISMLADPYEDELLIEKLYGMAEQNLNCQDVLSVFEGIEDKGALYYKTDHHWTSLGAYTAYASYMREKQRLCPSAEEFTVTTAEGFCGSTYSRAALWLTPAEPLEMWERTQGLQVTNGESEAVHEGIFYEERLNEADKYTVYLDGNHSVVTIHNPENAGKGSILVLRDSYSNCLGGFLAESYETVVLVDLRYYKQPVSELYAKQNFEDVLVCYSLGNFMTDNNLIWLK